MKKLETKVDVLQHIQEVYESCDTFKDLYKQKADEFICISINRLCENDLITDNLRVSTRKALIKPTIYNAFKDFAQHDLWLGAYAWWGTNDLTSKQQKELIEQKSLYLKQLINHLNNK